MLGTVCDNCDVLGMAMMWAGAVYGLEYYGLCRCASSLRWSNRSAGRKRTCRHNRLSIQFCVACLRRTFSYAPHVSPLWVSTLWYSCPVLSRLAVDGCYRGWVYSTLRCLCTFWSGANLCLSWNVISSCSCAVSEQRAPAMSLRLSQYGLYMLRAHPFSTHCDA